KARRRVGDGRAADALDDPTAQLLQQFLGQRKVLDGLDRPRADDDVGAAGYDRIDELLNVTRVILVVGVGVYDDVCTAFEARLDAEHERRSEAAIVGEPDDVVHAVLSRDVARVVGAAVINDQN